MWNAWVASRALFETSLLCSSEALIMYAQFSEQPRGQASLRAKSGAEAVVSKRVLDGYVSIVNLLLIVRTSYLPD